MINPQKRRFEKEFSCGVKKAYDTWHQANFARTRLRKKKSNYWTADSYKGQMGSLTIYKCHYCHYWHVGHGASKKGRTREDD